MKKVEDVKVTKSDIEYYLKLEKEMSHYYTVEENLLAHCVEYATKEHELEALSRLEHKVDIIYNNIELIMMSFKAKQGKNETEK
jgi:hypothetical protein